MPTSNAKRIFYKNVKRIGVICQSAVSKLPTSCLQGYSVSLPRNTPDCPGCNNSHVALERGEKCPLSPFSLFSMASSLVLFVFGHGVQTSNLGDASARELFQANGDFLLEKLGLKYLPPAIRPNMREARERFKKTRSLCVMWGLLAMFSDGKWLFWDLPISVRKSRISPPFEFLSCTACWSKKQGAGMLTSNAKRILCENVTCFGTNKCSWNRSHMGWILWKLWHGAICRLTLKNLFFLQTKDGDNNTKSPVMM